jgi:hypothetical protein
MNAFEVTENDASEAITGKPETAEKPNTKPAKKSAATSPENPTDETLTTEEDFRKQVGDTIKNIAMKNLPIKKDLVNFIKTDVGITLKEIGTTSIENLERIDDYITNYKPQDIATTDAAV